MNICKKNKTNNIVDFNAGNVSFEYIVWKKHSSKSKPAKSSRKPRKPRKTSKDICWRPRLVNNRALLLIYGFYDVV